MTTPVQPLKLSDAILAGCKIAPRKIGWRFFDVDGSACVMGAAALGAGYRIISSGSFGPGAVWEYLSNVFPERFHGDRECGDAFISECVHRNNATDESRESIASWLAEQGL